MYGIFFFTSQYFQLVLGFSPLESGLWSLPGLLAMMVVSSAIVPRLAVRFRPGYLVAGGMTICAIGFALLTQLDADDGLALLVLASTITSIGIAPATTLGTNLIVGSAPPESAGAASGVAQTGNELGGALGIALLGTLGTAIYRDQIAEAIPHHAPAAAADSAHDTLGGAVAVAGHLPPGLLDAAHSAFASGLHAAAAVCMLAMLGAAAITARFLRHVPPAGAVEAAPAEADRAEPRRSRSGSGPRRSRPERRPPFGLQPRSGAGARPGGRDDRPPGVPTLSAALSLVVFERDAETDPELGDLPVGNRHVLADHLGDPQLAHRLAGRLDRIARRLLP